MIQHFEQLIAKIKERSGKKPSKTQKKLIEFYSNRLKEIKQNEK